VYNIIKRLAIISTLLAICGPALRAQSTGTTVEAASCQQAAVNAVINGPKHTAVDGDTISIPDGSCTWSAGIVVPKGIGITIIGSGAPNTNPTCNGSVTAGCGAGSVSTVITVAGSFYAFYAQPNYGNSLTRFSLIDFETSITSLGKAPIIVVGACTVSGCPNLRVDNVVFGSGWTLSQLSGAGVVLPNNVFGVVDHSTAHGMAFNGGTCHTPNGCGLVLTNISHSAWQGVGQYGDNSWAQPDTFGTNQALYVENNLFDNGSGCDDTDAGVSFTQIGGARYVCRFNLFNGVGIGGAVLNHGTETGGRFRGARQYESYNNYAICMNSSGGCGSLTNARSGVGMVFNNTAVAGSGWFNNTLNLSTDRVYRGPFIPWGFCDGSGVYDLNDGTVYATGTVTTAGGATFADSSKSWTTNQWAGAAVTNGVPYSIHDVTQGFGSQIVSNTNNQYTLLTAPTNQNGSATYTFNVGDTYQILRATACLDQPSRSGGTLLSGATPATGWSNQVLDPTYEWAETTVGNFSNHTTNNATNELLANRDFYVNSHNQTAQQSPTSPFTGNPSTGSGTGFGTFANAPPTCAAGVAYWATDQGNWNQSGSGGQGQLYLCTATNTWTLSYTPYTYPHPLVAGGGTSGGGVNPPVGLTATVQ
jgi:hypothetical protein